MLETIKNIQIATLKTGIEQLDAIMQSTGPGCLIVVTGQPKSGKTWIVQNWLAQNFLRLRTSKEVNDSGVMPQYTLFTDPANHTLALSQIIQTHMEAHTSADFAEMPFPETKKEIDTLAQRMSLLNASGLNVQSHNSLSLEHIEGALMQVLQQSPVGLAVIDYPKPLSLPYFNGSEEEHADLVADGLRQLADSLAVTLVVTCPTQSDPEHPNAAQMPLGLLAAADVIVNTHRADPAEPGKKAGVELTVMKPELSSELLKTIRSSNAQRRVYSLSTGIREHAKKTGRVSTPAPAHVSQTRH